MIVKCPICGKNVNTQRGREVFKSLTDGSFWRGEVPAGHKMSSRVYTVGNDCYDAVPESQVSERCLKLLHTR